MIVRVPAASISQIGRNTQGVRLVNLKDGDHLIAAARVVESDDDNGNAGATTESSDAGA